MIEKSGYLPHIGDFFLSQQKRKLQMADINTSKNKKCRTDITKKGP